MRVFISAPYSAGDPALNVRTAIAAADAVLDAGHFPYVPHLSHLHHLVSPKPYEEWLRIDLAWLAVCDCLVRLPGESPGADREVAEARRLGLLVYHGIEAWLEALS